MNVIRIVCNICNKQIDGNPALPHHFCNRHEPYAKEYLEAVNKIVANGMNETNNAIERYKRQFLNNLHSNDSNLKAV